MNLSVQVDIVNKVSVLFCSVLFTESILWTFCLVYCIRQCTLFTTQSRLLTSPKKEALCKHRGESGKC